MVIVELLVRMTLKMKGQLNSFCIVTGSSSKLFSQYAGKLEVESKRVNVS